MEQTTAPKPFVFVLMPFDTAFDDTYQLGIKAACNDAGAYCERVDEQIFEDSILQRVYNQIAKADVLIADMTGRNPNVFYEVGYAHALGKHPILLTQKADDIPFDLIHYPHIVYDGKITELKKKLEKRVRWALENPKEFRGLAERRINVFLDGKDILEQTSINVVLLENRGSLEFEFENSTEKAIKTAIFKVGIMSDIPLRYLCDDTQSSHHQVNPIIGSGKPLYLFDKSFELLPGYWEKLKIAFHPGEGHNLNNVHFVLRIYSEAGVQEYPFDLRILSCSDDIISVGN